MDAFTDLPCARSCHPALSAISNRRFYGGRLRDGVTEAQRAALPHVPLPPLAFVHVQGSAQQDPHSRSSYNKAEVSIGINSSSRAVGNSNVAAYNQLQSGSHAGCSNDAN